MAKAYAAKVAVKVTNEAMQIHGGYGYVDSDLGRYYRDARVIDITEGTGEIQKYIVTRECYRESGLPLLNGEGKLEADDHEVPPKKNVSIGSRRVGSRSN